VRYGHSEERLTGPDCAPPTAEFGRDLIAPLTDTEERYAVITMEIPWNLVRDRVSRPPAHVAFVRDMRLESLQVLERAVPPVDLVLGIGGGSSHDSAKYVAMKRDARLVQVPTIISGDASVTDAIGVREQGRVSYIGHAEIERVVVDYSLLRQAPERLVRYGAADVLSSHTALRDWQIAAEAGHAELDPAFYDQAQANLKRLHQAYDEIRALSDEGIRTIIELYIDYARIAACLGNDRCQEGSEHFFAYNAEYVTGRTYLHGGLLATGIFVMSYVQDNEHEHVRQLMDKSGLEYGLDTIGLSRDEFLTAFTTLKDFVREGRYYYSVIDASEMGPEQAEELYEKLK
jgi:glycerol dehydrogenase-like iron-containing ADH family enzyme